MTSSEMTRFDSRSLMRVFDAWWPWRFGVVISATKTRATVKWSDGEIWVYDRAHWKFVRQA